MVSGLNKRSYRSCPGLPDNRDLEVQSYAGRCSYAWCMVAMRGLPQREPAEVRAGCQLNLYGCTWYSSFCVCSNMSAVPAHAFLLGRGSARALHHHASSGQPASRGLRYADAAPRSARGSVWIHLNWSNLWQDRLDAVFGKLVCQGALALPHRLKLRRTRLRH